MTVAEAAAYLRVSKRSVWRRLASGDLPRVKVGKSTRIPADAVRNYGMPGLPAAA